MKFDVIIIGGGRSGMAKAVSLQKEGRSCAVICKGRSLYGFEPEEFISLGGRLLMDEVVSSDVEAGSVKSVRTLNLGPDVELCADTFYLATGKFLSGGLKSDMEKVYEPLFGLDVQYDADCEKWSDPDFAAMQPFMSFGVKVDESGCALKGGEKNVNLFPIGEVLAK